MNTITIYSKANCPGCMAAKNFAKARGIELDEKRIDLDPEVMEELVSMGYNSVPVMIVEGKEPLVGFNPQAMLALAEDN